MNLKTFGNYFFILLCLQGMVGCRSAKEDKTQPAPPTEDSESSDAIGQEEPLDPGDQEVNAEVESVDDKSPENPSTDHENPDAENPPEEITHEDPPVPDNINPDNSNLDTADETDNETKIDEQPENPPTVPGVPNPPALPMPPDLDKDAIADATDNCVVVHNPDQTDTDQDGAGNACDPCPTNAKKINPGTCGCAAEDKDSDWDKTLDCLDSCPLDSNKKLAGICGCGVSDQDADKDNTADCKDKCPLDGIKTAPGTCGCGLSDGDSDKDGTPDCKDTCPLDKKKILPGICGCGLADADSDADGQADCVDACTQDKMNDVDKDGICGNLDACPLDPLKSKNTGSCGCGIADKDADTDGTADCKDACPNDAGKTQAGLCGCGVSDKDADTDGTPDCKDSCPADPGKNQPGLCGCGVSDKDSDVDQVPDCKDNCPGIANSDQANLDGDKNGGNACDTDDDNDGFKDTNDNCPLKFNSDQINIDNDGFGDACDDELPPRPNFVSPENWAKDVPTNQAIMIEFTEEVLVASFTANSVSLTNDEDMTIQGTLDFIGKTVLFRPDDPLEAESTYKVTLAKQITDLAGNPLEQDFSWIFETGPGKNAKPLSIKQKFPQNKETSIPTNQIVVIEFVTPLNPETISPQSLVVTTNSVPVSGIVDYTGNFLAFIPSTNFSKKTAYKVKLSAPLQDITANGLPTNAEWSFTTGDKHDAIQPQKYGMVFPNNFSTELQNIIVKAGFDKRLNPLTINTYSVVLNQNDGTPVYGSVRSASAEASGEMWKIEFVPFAPLTGYTVHQPGFLKTITDFSHNPLVQDYSWNFKTIVDPFKTHKPPPEELVNEEHEALRNFVTWMRENDYPENIVSKWVLDYMNPIFHEEYKNQLNILLGQKFKSPITIKLIDLIPTDAGTNYAPVDVAVVETLLRETIGMNVQIEYIQHKVNYTDNFGTYVKDICYDYDVTPYKPYECAVYDIEYAVAKWVEKNWNLIATGDYHKSIVRTAITEVDGLPASPRVSVAPAGIAYVDNTVPSLDNKKTFHLIAHEWGHTWGQKHQYVNGSSTSFGTLSYMAMHCNKTPVSQILSAAVPMSPLITYRSEPLAGYDYPELVSGGEYYARLQEQADCEIPFTLNPTPKVTLQHTLDAANKQINVTLTNAGNLPLAFVNLEIALEDCKNGNTQEELLPWLEVNEKWTFAVPLPIDDPKCKLKETYTLSPPTINLGP